MSLELVLAAMALAISSAAAALVLPRASSKAQGFSAILMVSSMISGLAGAMMRLFGHADSLCGFPWQAAGGSAIGLDALSAFFLVPIFLIGGLGSVYGMGYWRRERHPRSARPLEVFWGLLVAGLCLLVIARHAMAFLLGWEVMALSAFFLVITEDFRHESRRAGFIYIIGTHIGILVLFAFFVLWRKATGSYSLMPIAGETIALGTMGALFLLALVGFGIKAGLMPLHFWLPGAHASAPSHVSAMLSGVVLKMGVYGLLRFLSLIEDPPAIWGVLILALGAASCVLGVVFALGQHDMKRLLAYHSVENIGIIFMGMGLALMGRSSGDPALIVLGLAGCLLHVWNHSLFKSLLFFGAGSVLHAAHTRETDRLGGLAKAMPWTAATFLVGAVAICGLPPLNGFVSELFIYFGLFGGLTRGGAGVSIVPVAAPLLAVTGALALACFVKVYGAVFLGLPRSPAARQAEEATLSMRFPMVILALACVLIGVAPGLTVLPLDEAIAPWKVAGGARLPSLASLVPLDALGGFALLLAVLCAFLFLVFAGKDRSRAVKGSWDCGYAQPTPRMQYTASSFAQSIVGLFSWALRQRVKRMPIKESFPRAASMQSHVDDAVLDGILIPAFRRLEGLSSWFRRFQQGLAQDYILFIFITVFLLLSTLLPVKDILARIFAR